MDETIKLDGKFCLLYFKLYSSEKNKKDVFGRFFGNYFYKNNDHYFYKNVANVLYDSLIFLGISLKYFVLLLSFASL